MATTTVGAPGSRANDLETIEDLAAYVRKLRALLRAAINCGAKDRDDEAWLVSLAFDVAESAEARICQWEAPDGEAA